MWANFSSDYRMSMRSSATEFLLSLKDDDILEHQFCLFFVLSKIIIITYWFRFCEITMHSTALSIFPRSPLIEFPLHISYQFKNTHNKPPSCQLGPMIDHKDLFPSSDCWPQPIPLANSNFIRTLDYNCLVSAIPSSSNRNKTAATCAWPTRAHVRVCEALHAVCWQFCAYLWEVSTCSLLVHSRRSEAGEEF